MREEEAAAGERFGTRYLTDADKVFDHNAWDNVPWDESMEEDALKVVDKQRSAKVEEERAAELVSDPAKQWDAFYSIHTNKFFMDRNWLLKEFPEFDMTQRPEGTKIRALEVGCGVGNTTFPLLELDPTRKMFLYSCDYSKVAVDVLRGNEKYDETHGHAFVWDITQPPPALIEPASLDLISCIYVLSAIHPTKTADAVRHLVSLLKPGGALLLKDYGKYDLTQLRFKKDRLIEENLYCRGDGTLVFFRTQDEMHDLLAECGLEKQANLVDRRLIVNRAKQVKMYRVWLQAKYTKPL